METLFVYSLLYGVGYDKYEEYRKELDRIFLEDPENDVLLDLEYRAPKDAMLHSYYLMQIVEYDTVAFGKCLMKNLKAIYETSNLMDFSKKMYDLWMLLPENINSKNPFFILSYAGDYLSYGDENQCSALYEEALNYYEVKTPDSEHPIASPNEKIENRRNIKWPRMKDLKRFIRKEH